MAYEGWFTYGGTEIVNASRTSAYIKTLLHGTKVHEICAGDCQCDHLAAFLGDAEYASPIADDAPWVDPDRPESYEFLGVYPLDVTGLTDSTVTAQKTEGMSDGGWITGRRHAIKDVLFSVVLFSTTERGDDYGQAWLKAALDGACEDDCLSGAQLCFLSECANPDDFTGSVVTTEHGLSDWRLYRSNWTDRTINLAQQESWAELQVAGSCGDIEWDVTVRGEPGNNLAIIHEDGQQELHVLDGSVQTLKITTFGNKFRMGVPDVTGMASWQEPDTEAELDSMTLLDAANHLTGFTGAPGGTQTAWDQFTTIPLPVEIVQVISNARFANSDDECAAEYMRYLRQVKNIDGPRTRRRDVLSNGGIARTMDFVLSAEKPFVYGEPVLAAKGTDKDLVPMAVPYRTMRLTRNINDCTAKAPKVVLDPLGPVIPPPPPPSLRQTNNIPVFTPSRNPYAVLVPASTVPMWLNAVPVVKVTAGAKDVRQIRVRFFPVPLDSYMPNDIDPCSSCGSFQIEYIPKGGTFTFDATQEQALVTVGGKTQDAAHLLAGDKGVGGASWPLLSCGVPYMILIDSRDQALSDVEVYMVVRS